ncbi:mitotic checkpoint regulator, MAD2B-interacting-domain-containing protein [Xylariomycetidae sp. FL2044]|nr:mitotic checkpoint regulator, MAD2B-interacting-domain-containing protein [Xylariomycetidae sp. FL2044]
MGLVDYSDSESDSGEPVATKPTAAAAPAPSSSATSKKPFQKVVDRSKPGRIVVNLPSTTGGGDQSSTTTNDEPPPKRARTARGGGAFSGFNSFLPPPKNVGKPPAAASGPSKSAPRPGVSLKTGAAPAFSRNSTNGEVDEGWNEGGDAAGMGLPEPKSSQQGPTIPEGQKPAEEVKLVGKPLMFRPLSVSRKPVKKNVAKTNATAKITTQHTPAAAAPAGGTGASQQDTGSGPPPKKKVKKSLFSISNDDDDDNDAARAPNTNGTYEPLFTTTATAAASSSSASDPTSHAAALAAYDASNGTTFPPTNSSSSSSFPDNNNNNLSSQTLDSLASTMNLSASARRELFGRNNQASQQRVVTFDTGREYAHNEALRASGEQTTYNPVRAIAAGGKNSLQTLVSSVRNNRDALEESFAKGKSNQRDAGARYGWR